MLLVGVEVVVLERLGRVWPVAQQVQMPPTRREQLRQPCQIDLLGAGWRAVDPVGAEHPAPVTRADPGVRLQTHPGGLGPPGACGRAQPAGFPRGRHHDPEAEPPGCARPARRERLLRGPGGQGPLQDLLGHAAERGDAGTGFGVEADLAIRAVALEQASADLEECGDEVSDAEPVAVGQPVQVRQVRLALQRREP
ncbi:hypothetical protein ACFYSH_15315 [Streptomyces sp. NPDC005791]|uniref:hypothetical protein n=1 Tax=Streptomyces sp. NPDC005791 TaxID=3364732 RepID=UPI0036D0BA21